MPPQEPYVFGNATTAIMRSALNTRYQLLPFYYTLFYAAHTTGSTVWRPLFFEWPEDAVTWDLDEQFLIGGEILVSPVLQDMARSVKAYFPDALWYEDVCVCPLGMCANNAPRPLIISSFCVFVRGRTVVGGRYDFYTGAAEAGGQWRTLAAPLETINMHVRGGAIIPMQVPCLLSLYPPASMIRAETPCTPLTVKVELYMCESIVTHSLSLVFLIGECVDDDRLTHTALQAAGGTRLRSTWIVPPSHLNVW